MLAVLAWPMAAGSPTTDAVSAGTSVAAAYTLWGSATKGWGNASGAESNPGPTLYVYAGQNVSLRLYSDDGASHNWTIDANNNQKVDAGEIASPDFSSASKPLLFNFTVPAKMEGSWTYRCGIHPLTMTGTIVVLTPPNITLYGGAALGWGFTSATASSPGPTLYVLADASITLHLYSVDNATHDFFVDFNNNKVIDGVEKNTTSFSSSTVPLVVNYTIPGSVASGNYTYRCHYHAATMFGYILVFNALNVKSVTPSLPLVPTIMVIAIVVVLILAAVYQVRAVRASRRSK